MILALCAKAKVHNITTAVSNREPARLVASVIKSYSSLTSFLLASSPNANKSSNLGRLYVSCKFAFIRSELSNQEAFSVFMKRIIICSLRGILSNSENS